MFYIDFVCILWEIPRTYETHYDYKLQRKMEYYNNSDFYRFLAKEFNFFWRINKFHKVVSLDTTRVQYKFLDFVVML